MILPIYVYCLFIVINLSKLMINGLVKQKKKIKELSMFLIMIRIVQTILLFFLFRFVILIILMDEFSILYHWTLCYWWYYQIRFWWWWWWCVWTSFIHFFLSFYHIRLICRTLFSDNKFDEWIEWMYVCVCGGGGGRWRWRWRRRRRRAPCVFDTFHSMIQPYINTTYIHYITFI